MTPQEKIKYYQIIEKYLDKGYGSCLLKDSRNAQIVLDTWKFFNGERYDLIAYVVMPNHVHLLIKTYEKWPLAKVVHSWKSYTAKEILKNEYGDDSNAGGSPALPNKVWQREYWDRFIRDENHFLKVIEYIHQNPVKAGLCKLPEQWLWSSAYKPKEN
ncbi:transposase [Lentisphaera marina]|uniref:REP-associated tyrosine transposase n=1 Tax=Lentisphaera marina TaxID=1111041 RepID=UPI0023665742|nr:transposase [Lentisphaera marina]MDD7985223.1 transposase [Lentisphaera marina]